MIETARGAITRSSGPGETTRLAEPQHQPVPDRAINERVNKRLWIIACCLSLAVLAFVDRPGKIIGDTKLDMAVNPIGFLARALHLWDPAQFGQLQDQATGYFFPMGPFFAIGKLTALPPWVVQRLWLTAILLAAFFGVSRLTARLRVGTPATQLAAGLVYALAPRSLSELGVISVEILPAAMAPWIMLPLVRALQDDRGSRRTSRMRAAAQSAVAVALCGGVNAAATIAALMPAVIFLLSAPRPAPRFRLLAWWTPMVAMATWWWAYPLLLLAKYGVSIFPYTESAATTTAVTSLSNTLRGTEDWVSYLVVNGHPWWPIGFWLATNALPTVLTGLLAGIGLVGVLKLRTPLRRPLLLILLAGVLIVVTGYRSGFGNPLAPWLYHLINGPLAPFRNLRKFDLMIRLPLAIGVGHLLARVRVPAPRRLAAAVPTPRKLAAATTAVAICILAAPAYIGGLSAPGDFAGIPRYWLDASNWLNRHAGNQAVLAVPGARFGEYLWGRPMDDVLEALFKGDWASRQLESMGPAGKARLLEAIDERFASGDGSAGLTQVLARMGIKYLVVRNDLIRSDLRGAWPARIHEAIGESPGIVKVAQFGALPVGSSLPDNAVNSFDSLYPPVEIYQVSSSQPMALVQPTASAIGVYGGPEALLKLADYNLLRDRPVLLNSDSSNLPVSQTVVTDSLRRRVRNFGELRVDYSPTLTATDPALTIMATDDYLLPAWRQYLAVARYDGIANVTASSSDADINAITSQSATGLGPFSAVDSDLRTMWESGGLTGPLGQWIKLDFVQPIHPHFIDVSFAENRAIGPPVARVVVTTAAGHLADRVGVTGTFQRLRVPAGLTGWLRITITGIQWKGAPLPGRQVGISEISVPGISPSRTIVAPTVNLAGNADPTAYVLSKAEPQPDACMLTSARWVCSPALQKPTEEWYGFDHSFFAARSQAASLSGSAILTNPKLITKYLWDFPGQPKVTGSSSYTSNPLTQPESAFDANPATTWVASRTDRQPKLAIEWAHKRLVSKVTIVRPTGASDPLQVELVGSHGQVRSGLVVGPTTTLRFSPILTKSLRFTFSPQGLPLEITDITIPGVSALSAGGSARFRLGCGFGPLIHLDGKLIPTSVSGTFGDVLASRPLSFAACGPVRIASGANRVVEPSWDSFDVQSVVLDRTGAQAMAAGPALQPGSVTVAKWTAAQRILRVDASQSSYLVLNQNFNQGWVAVSHGRALRPVQLDGWKQAWLMPPGTHGDVTLTYSPDAGYRRNLLVGFVALGLVIFLAAVPWRRRRLPLSSQESSAPAASAESPGSARGEEARTASQQRRSARLARLSLGAVLVPAGIASLSFAGFWLAGYLGAFILPAVCMIFTVMMLDRGNRLYRVALSPWLVLLLLVAASVAGAVGVRLQDAEYTGNLASALWDTSPQLLCLIIVGRLIAALIVSDQDEAGPEGLESARGEFYPLCHALRPVTIYDALTRIAWRGYRSFGRERSFIMTEALSADRQAYAPNETAIWLADLTHYGQGPASETMPIGIAFLAAYVQQECRLSEPVRLFKYPAALAHAIEQLTLPAVVGFSNYIWNSSLSLGFAKLIKRCSPSTTIVMGGPHFPAEPHLIESFLRDHPEVDFYVDGEGEQAFAQLIRLIGTGGNWRSRVADQVQSLRWLDEDGQLRMTPLTSRLRDLDVIPSPYLSGMLDDFFDGKLAPTLQTNRGCPFTCTFCVEGGNYYRKVNAFSEARIVAELEYIGAQMQRVIEDGGRDDLLITDSNFAMYHQDRTTCAQIKECRDRYGWPSRVNVTTGKNRRERVLESVRLADGAIQLSGAVQSLERTVLENIRRQNIDADALMAIAQQSGKQGTPTYSDVILGLPGDTREAHVATVSTLVNAGFGRINTFQCALLPGTELYDRAVRERFGIETRFRTIPRGFGRYPVGDGEVAAVEIDEVTVGTSTMTFDDYIWCRVFDLALFILYNDQVMVATAAAARKLGIDLGAFLARTADAAWPGRLGQIREEYVVATKGQLFGSRAECEAFAMANLDKFTGGDLGRNLLYTYRAICISEALEDVGRLAVALLAEDPAAVGHEDFLADAVRFDVLSLQGVLDPEMDELDVQALFTFDIPSLITAANGHDGHLAAFDEPVNLVFDMSKASRATRDAYARAMGRDASGIGRALTRVPIGDLKRVASITVRRPANGRSDSRPDASHYEAVPG